MNSNKFWKLIATEMGIYETYGEGGLRFEHQKTLQNTPEQVFHIENQIPANKPANNFLIPPIKKIN